MWMFVLPVASHAAEVMLQNDRIEGTADPGQAALVHLAYPECAAAVLDVPPEAVYPLTIHTIHVFLASSKGNQDHEKALVTLAIMAIENDEVPDSLYGFSEWTWPEEAFWVTVSSENLNALMLDDPEAGLWPLTIDAGRVAVFICTGDPEWNGDWPYTSETDTSGLVVDTTTSGANSFLESDDFGPLAEAGIQGDWVIRAVAEDSVPVVEVPLALEQIDPTETSLGTSAEVTVTGTGFEDGATLTIGSLAVGTPSQDGDHTLRGRSPSGLPVGFHDVMVTNPDGTTGTLKAVFEVGDLPASEEPTDSDAAAPEDGCGCAGGSRPGPWAVLSALLLLGARRPTTKAPE